MDVAEEQALADLRAAEAIVASVPLMPELSGVDVRLYQDHTGDPSLQLIFTMRPGAEGDDAFIQRFLDFAGGIQTKILHSKIRRFPYTRLVEAA